MRINGRFKVGQAYSLPDGEVITILDRNCESVQILEQKISHGSMVDVKVWKKIRLAVDSEGRYFESTTSRNFVILAREERW